MQADGVDAELGKVGRDLFRIGVLRKIRAEAGIHTPDAEAAGIGEEMPVANAHEPIGTRRVRREVGEVGGGRGGIIARDDEREPGVVGRGEERSEGGEGDGAGEREGQGPTARRWGDGAHDPGSVAEAGAKQNANHAADFAIFSVAATMAPKFRLHLAAAGATVGRVQLTHIPSLPWEEIRSPGGRFHSFFRNISVALGGIRNGGLWCGGHPFDLQIRRIPAGAAVCPFHSHLGQWELFLVQSGTATIRAGAETHVARAGEVFVHPPGEPHQMINHGPDALEVLIIADNPEFDAFHYPDSDKWGLRPPGKYFRMTEVGYFDGEEPPAPGAPPYRPSGTPPAPQLPPFATRKVHPDSLPWDEWQSPGGKYHGASKELSIALGAKRNTPTGLGGHPFDLELSRLRPGKSGCPYHAHAAQWELFLLLEGEAVVRAGAESHRLRAGDVVLHPPSEAHQITNASATTDLLFLLVSDNPAVDYWSYPDSKKWGLRAPRMFFRPEPLDYWDGEE
jgi:uncharacterized cupin superfamily protein